MKRYANAILSAFLIIVIAIVGVMIDPLMPRMGRAVAEETTPQAGELQKSHAVDRNPLTVDEARGRARLLHESFHATLHFVHEEYYRPDQRLTIPATTLDRVFKELEKRRNVKLHWLAVNAQAMNVDHIPEDEFEKASVAALTAGKEEFESVEEGHFRFAGAIQLSSDCLKCHLPNRTSTKSKLAALVISMPLNEPAKP